MDWLSSIVRDFNDRFGNIEWHDVDRILRVIIEIPPMVASNVAYQNAMKNSDRQNARIEHDKALQSIIVSMMQDHVELFRYFMDNPDFKRWLTDQSFSRTYQEGARGA
jgi:type I restriction enzyme R subunit